RGDRFLRQKQRCQDHRDARRLADHHTAPDHLMINFSPAPTCISSPSSFSPGALSMVIPRWAETFTFSKITSLIGLFGSPLITPAVGQLVAVTFLMRMLRKIGVPFSGG